MNWPENYQLVGDSLIVDIGLPEEVSGLSLVNRDPRKTDMKPDCYVGDVKEVGARCKLVKVGDKVVFSRWQYSQSDLDDSRICIREVDLVIVNERCVNGFIAVKLYNPFQKTEQLIQVEGRRNTPRYFWGQIIDIDRNTKNTETKDLKTDDIILFQHMDDYQYYVGRHTMVFKNLYDVPLLVLTSLEQKLEVIYPEKEVVNA